jgi:hypothetical protein
MEHVTTYVGIDAHKKDLFVAMLTGPRDDASHVAGRERTDGDPAVGPQDGARGASARARLL